MKNREITPSSDQLDNQEIGSRSRRRRRGLFTLALTAFLVWQALASASAFAAVGSSASNSNIFIRPNRWTTLRQIVVSASNAMQYCTAVGSADIEVNSVSRDVYLFTLTLDDPQPPRNLGQERTVVFGFGDPIDVKAVTTTQGFTLPPGAAHTIFWLGRPDVSQSTGLVLDRSLSVVCDTNTLGIRNNNTEPLLED